MDHFMEEVCEIKYMFSIACHKQKGGVMEKQKGGVCTDSNLCILIQVFYSLLLPAFICSQHKKKNICFERGITDLY